MSGSATHELLDSIDAACGSAGFQFGINLGQALLAADEFAAAATHLDRAIHLFGRAAAVNLTETVVTLECRADLAARSSA